MTKTLAELEAIVRFRGDFRNSQRFPSANVTTEIQAAFGEFYELVDEVNQGYWDTTGTVPTVAAADFVALPTGTWRIRAVDRLDGTEYIPMRQVGIDDRNNYGTSGDRPLAYRTTARGIDLYPTPNAVYTLRVTYSPIAPTLDTTPRDYVNGWEEYVIFGALVRITLNQRRDASEWMTQLSMQRERVVRAASVRRSAEPELLPLHDHECLGIQDFYGRY